MFAWFGVASLALSSGALINVTAQGEQACPSVAQIEAALSLHLPGMVTASAAPGDVGVMRLEVRGAAGAPTIVLFDDRGTARLSRRLESSHTANDCAALAETVAIIVERYLDELDVGRGDPRPPAALEAPAAPQPVRVGLAALARARSGREGAGALGAELEFSLHKGLTRLLGARGLAGIALCLGGGVPEPLRWPALGSRRAGEGEAREFWASLAVGPAWELGGRGRHLLGGRGGAALALKGAARTEPDASDRRWAVQPWVHAEAFYRWHPGRRWFVHVALTGRVALVRHELVLEGPEMGAADRVVDRTPRVFADFGLGAGFAF